MRATPHTGFQLVDISPWPLSASFAALGLTSGMISLFCESVSNFVLILVLSSFGLLIFTLVRWWGDVILESTFFGCYSTYVVRNLRCAMLLFILSEVFFFVSFFWAFFNSSVGELSMQGVGVWPPSGVNPIYPWRVPFLNTIVLLSSAFTVTWAHKAISCHNMVNMPYSVEFIVAESDKNIAEFFDSFNFINYSNYGAGVEMVIEESSDTEKNLKNFKLYWIEGLVSLGLTIGLGLFFTYLQAMEYYMASFSICDSVYGSTFFLLTGFHGMHVMVGTIFLIVCWFRFYFRHFSFNSHYFGLDAAVFYWHFVDVVWIGVFFSVYVWGY